MEARSSVTRFIAVRFNIKYTFTNVLDFLVDTGRGPKAKPLWGKTAAPIGLPAGPSRFPDPDPITVAQ